MPGTTVRIQKNLSPSQICDDVGKLIAALGKFPKRVRYDPTGFFAPNSNSFTRWLLTFAPDLSVSTPAGAVGWGHLINGR